MQWSVKTANRENLGTWKEKFVHRHKDCSNERTTIPRIDSESGGAARAFCEESAPGGTPSLTEVVEAVSVLVTTAPEASVTMSVMTVGGSVITGRAEALTVGPFSNALYVLVPSAVVTVSPGVAGTEVLKT